jgi:DUF4097 and DUF4098 domain-containing protein YvlB
MNSIKMIAVPVLIFSALLGSTILSSTASAGEQIAKTLPSNNISNVMIENHSGTVSVVGWKKDKVTITGELDDEAEALVFEQKGAQLYIKVEYPNMNSWTSDGSSLTIFMPENIRVNFSGISSSLDVKNLSGGIEAGTVSGNINAEDLRNTIELSSISGNINSTNLSGKISLSAVSGNIEDKKSSGRLQLQAVSGDVHSNSMATEVSLNNVSGNSELSLSDVIELRLSTVSGDVEANVTLKDKGLLKASSVSGDVELTFQKDINAEFDLKSNVGGDLINKLSDMKAEHAKYGPGAKLNFQVGNGSSTVRVNTVNGNVIVK